MKLSVAYAAGSVSFRQDMDLPAPITAEQVILKSKLLDEFPAIDLNVLKIGIFGKVCKKDRLLEEGERVEVYQPTTMKVIDEDDDDD